MHATIAKWGNSLALRLPRSIAADANLAEGSPVEILVEDSSLVVRAARPKYRLADLLSRFKAEQQRGEEDWGAPRGEEVW